MTPPLNYDHETLFHRLEQVHRDLHRLLLQRDVWRGKHITYEYPHVERIYTDLDDGYRVMLHRIEPLPTGTTPLYHPHPWPSIVRVLTSGDPKIRLTNDCYCMRAGRGDQVDLQIESYGELTYSMPYPNSWHSVHPYNVASWSIMLVGKPFDPNAPKTTTKSPEMTREAVENLISTWLDIL